MLQGGRACVYGWSALTRVCPLDGAGDDAALPARAVEAIASAALAHARGNACLTRAAVTSITEASRCATDANSVLAGLGAGAAVRALGPHARVAALFLAQFARVYTRQSLLPDGLVSRIEEAVALIPAPFPASGPRYAPRLPCAQGRQHGGDEAPGKAPQRVATRHPPGQRLGQFIEPVFHRSLLHQQTHYRQSFPQAGNRGGLQGSFLGTRQRSVAARATS